MAGKMRRRCGGGLIAETVEMRRKREWRKISSHIHQLQRNGIGTPFSRATLHRSTSISEDCLQRCLNCSAPLRSLAVINALKSLIQGMQRSTSILFDSSPVIFSLAVVKSQTQRILRAQHSAVLPFRRLSALATCFYHI